MTLKSTEIRIKISGQSQNFSHSMTTRQKRVSQTKRMTGTSGTGRKLVLSGGAGLRKPNPDCVGMDVALR